MQQILDGELQVGFKVDNTIRCFVRVSMCVTEEKNDLNSPVMFYTPQREGYVANLSLMEGIGQEIIFGEVNFKMSLLANQNLTSSSEKYFPMIISINYEEDGDQYAYISYFVFTKNSQGDITAAKSVKQIVIVSIT